MWTPELARREGPRYQAIADALGDDVARGVLAPGQRLPTHRELAGTLGVTVGTVSRAYAEAERRGLVEATVGRGTFVAASLPVPSSWGEPAGREGVVDLSLSVPAVGCTAEERRTLAEAFAALGRRPDLSALLSPQPHAGALHHRAAAA